MCLMPIKEVRWVRVGNRRCRTNICLDRQGRECVPHPHYGYALLSKDGERVLKRKADF